MVGSVSINTSKKLRRSLHFVATKADANNVALAEACREFEHLLCFLHSEVPGRIENPPQRHAEIARPPCTPAFEALEDRREVLIADQTHADRNIDFRMQ